MAKRVLGQSAPAAATNTDVYTVGGGLSAVVSTLVICNTTGGYIAYRVAVRPAGAAITTAHYLIKDSLIPANSADFLTVGITLAAGDVVTVYASLVGVAVTLFGDEA